MTLEEMLVFEEGFRSEAYQDQYGYWTIGYGRLIDKRKGGGISVSEARMLLHNDIAEKTKAVSAAISWFSKLDQVRRDVLVAMAFQMGVEGLLAFKGMLAALKAGDYHAAAEHIRSSLWAKQTPGRANRMAKAIETGVL